MSAKIHGKKMAIGTAGKTVSSAGAVTIELTLTQASKAVLAGANGKFVVIVVATFKPKHGKAKTSRSTAILH